MIRITAQTARELVSRCQPVNRDLDHEPNSSRTKIKLTPGPTWSGSRPGHIGTTLPKQALQLQNKPGLVGPYHSRNMLAYGICNKRSIS